MTTDTTHVQFRFIPARNLSLSPLNVRKTGGDDNIEQLAELIAAEGVLQNLGVYEDPNGEGKKKTTHAVIAGGRRWRALQRLIKQKRIKPDYAVPCMVVSRDRAVQISLSENSGREAMHPADEFDAFRQLIDAGQSVEDVAARFGVAPIVVQRRLKLANVAPEFIAAYRQKEVSLEILMALAVTDDHEKQRLAWKGLPTYNRSAHAVRQALTASELSVGAPLAQFVGAAYEKAGGQVRRDLFAERDGGGFILDCELLKRLAAEKLEKQAARLKAEGFAWVEVRPQLEYSDLAAFGRVGTVLRDATEAEQAQLDAISAERQALEAQVRSLPEDDERHEQLEDRFDKLADAEEVVIAARRSPNPEQLAVAGAIVSIDHEGKARIVRDLLKPQDAKRFARTENQRQAETSQDGARTHSEALTRRLTAHRSAAVRVLLSERPDVALVALTHRLAAPVCCPLDARADSDLEITCHETSLTQFGKDVEAGRGHQLFEEKRAAWADRLPGDADRLFAWLLDQPQAVVLDLLAFCVARSLYGVSGYEDAGPIDALAKALDLDMRQWWTATAQTYLASVPKARILEVVTEAVSPEAAASLAKLKKAGLVQAAEEKLASTGWLPAFLRNNK